MEEQLGSPAGNAYHSIVAHGSARVHAGDVNDYYLDNRTKQEQNCYQTFKTSSYEEYKDRNPFRVEGTCQWVLTHPQYQQWRRSKHDNLLWISADPGCGKSVLAKSLVDRDLDLDSESLVCYFFFKDNDGQDNLATALCALLHQMFTQQPDLIRHALPVFEKNGNELRQEIQALWRILEQSAVDPATPLIICVLDALDECRDDDRRRLISLLCDFLQHSARIGSNTKLKFLVTSRPYDSVQRWFEQTTLQWPQIRLRGEDQNPQIHKEINLVIEKHVLDLAREFVLSSSSQARLGQQLFDMQHRTYLWLHLAIEEIRETYKNSLYPEEEVIVSLPLSVGDAYERLLQKINDKQKLIARQVLLIIVGARRPLKVGEMAQALAAARAQKHETESLIVPNTQHLERQIRQWCGLFVFIQHSTLFLIHQTAKEFLLSNNLNPCPDSCIWRASLSPSLVDLELLKLCTMFLCATFHTTEPERMGGWLRDREAYLYLNEEPEAEVSESIASQASFFCYCAEYWTVHLRDDMVVDDTSVFSRILTLYDVKSGLFYCWFDHYRRVAMPQELAPNMPIPHVMALNGHICVLKHVYDRQLFDLEALDSEGRRALHRAAGRGHLNTTRWLLEKRATVNTYSETHGNALYAASCNGHDGVVQVLLQKGASINIPGGEHGNALCAAAQGGHERVVHTLLSAGADVNSRRRDNDALCVASEHGFEKIVQMLVEQGADVDVEGRLGISLQVASYYGHEKLVQMLLNHMANIATSDDKDRALYLAIVHDKERIVQMLLRNGATLSEHSKIALLSEGKKLPDLA